MDHPSPEDLRAFVLARLAPADDRRVEAHLADGCEICLFAARRFFPDADFDTRETIHALLNSIYHPDDAQEQEKDRKKGGITQAMRQATRFRFLFTCEAGLSDHLLRELDRRPPGPRRTTIRTAERYQLFGFSERLCQYSRQAGFSDVARSLELAELAVEVADALDAVLYMPAIVADQQGIARAFLGNARRIASDLFGADQAFHEGRQFLAQGTRSKLLHAEFDSLLGSLRIDQARYPEASQLLAASLAAFRSWGHPDEIARVLLKFGLCAGYAGDAEIAVERFAQAAEVLGDIEDDRLRLQAEHNLSFWLVEAGDSLEALARFRKAQTLYDQFPDDPWVQLRRRWAEGRIYAGLGDLQTAQNALEEVRAQAARRELMYEFAMVSLELALVALRRGQTHRVQDLAEELAPIFASQDLHRHALGAMYLFRQAARTDTTTPGLLQEILRYLARARNNPFLRFDPEARWG